MTLIIIVVVVVIIIIIIIIIRSSSQTVQQHPYLVNWENEELKKRMMTIIKQNDEWNYSTNLRLAFAFVCENISIRNKAKLLLCIVLHIHTFAIELRTTANHPAWFMSAMTLSEISMSMQNNALQHV